MTTSWTPLACRSTQCRCHAMCCAQPINGRLSIGLVRVELLVLAGVSPKITFTAAQAREHAPAGIRRSICDCSWPHGVRAEVPRPCLHRASAIDNALRPFARPSRDAIGRSESLPVCNRVVKVAGRPERLRSDANVHVCVIDSYVGGNIGEAHGFAKRQRASRSPSIFLANHSLLSTSLIERLGCRWPWKRPFWRVTGVPA